jgi:hypothetical protein
MTTTRPRTMATDRFVVATASIFMEATVFDPVDFWARLDIGWRRVLVQSNSNRLRGVVGGGLLAVVCMLLFAGTAHGAPALVFVDTTTPKLGEGEDGASKVDLSFTNLRDGPVVLSAKALFQRDCKLELSANQLKPERVTAVSVEVPADGCDAGEKLKIRVGALSTAGPLRPFLVNPEGTPSEDPCWQQLLAFVAALVLAFGLVGFLYRRKWNPSGKVERKLSQPLTNLDPDSWKFTDSWATNVTAIGALLTGLLGASTVKAFLGDDAESALALGTVGAAIALSLVGAAPVVLIAFKRLEPAKKVNDKKVAEVNLFTVGGLLGAFALVVASGLGQLWVVSAMALELDLAGMQYGVPGLAFLAAALLVFYVWRSVPFMLEHGTQEPAKVRSEVKALDSIAAAIRKATKEPPTAAEPEQAADLVPKPDASLSPLP